jgi:NADH pyrophosphatase NudC (nudix superfamily)
MKSCPFGCSYHVFPNHFNFCPYCGTKLAISESDDAFSNSRAKNRRLKNAPRL